MKQSGSAIGCSLLIAGSCIGAGMLALPIVSGQMGFFPSLVMFLVAGSFMTCTALLLVEVNTWFDGPVNLISMVEHTLGPIGRYLCWLLYLFLFYALIVAYMSGSGNHVAALIPVPDWVGTFFFVVVFAGIVYLGTRPVDLMNRGLMVGKISAYVGLLILGFSHVKASYLAYAQVDTKILAALPVLVISFGFHNMIPSMVHYLDGDVKRVRKAILGGALFALLIYLFWQLIVLGALPEKMIKLAYREDVDAAQALRNYLQVSTVGIFAQCLAFFAILTSFLAQTLSLVHFLRDGLKIKHSVRENPYLCMLALAPPLLCTILYPQIFFKALNFAGGICAVILFGIFPALMVWIGRYKKNLESPARVPGGRPLLTCIFLFALLVFSYQLTQML